MPQIPRYEFTNLDSIKTRQELLEDAKRLKAKMINKMCNIADAVNEDPNLYRNQAGEIVSTAKMVDDAIRELDESISSWEASIPKELPDMEDDKIINFKDTNAYKDKRVKELASGLVYDLREVITKYKLAFDNIDYHLLVKYNIELDKKER